MGACSTYEAWFKARRRLQLTRYKQTHQEMRATVEVGSMQRRWCRVLRLLPVLDPLDAIYSMLPIQRIPPDLRLEFNAAMLQLWKEEVAAAAAITPSNVVVIKKKPIMRVVHRRRDSHAVAAAVR